MNKQNDKRLKGVGGAIGNSPKKITRKHPWHIPWRTNCLMCQSPVYHDGQIYWSLCLSHLQVTELGPFRKRPQPVAMDYSMGICLHCQKPYEARRSTRKCCSDTCRVYYNRCTQNASESPYKRRENLEYWDRVNYAYELYLKHPALERDNWLEDYIDNPTTKKITCNPDLLRSPKPKIAKVCNRCTQYKFGVNIRDYY